MQKVMESTKVLFVKNRILFKANGNQSSEGLKKKSTEEFPLRMVKGLRQNFGKSESPRIFLEKMTFDDPVSEVKHKKDVTSIISYNFAENIPTLPTWGSLFVYSQKSVQSKLSFNLLN